MSVHYSGQRAVSSGLVKAKLLQKFVLLLRAVPQAHGILHGSMEVLPEGSLTWDILAKLYYDSQQNQTSFDAAPDAHDFVLPPTHAKRYKKDKKDKKLKGAKHSGKTKKDKKHARDETDAAPPKKQHKDTRPSYRDRH